MNGSRIITKSIVLALLLVFARCDKDMDKANVLVHVDCQGEPVEQASVYVKLNATCNETSYDQLGGVDAIGEYYFQNVKPGTNCFYARGYSAKAKKYVSGSVSLQVGISDKKEFKITIYTN